MFIQHTQDCSDLPRDHRSNITQKLRPKCNKILYTFVRLTNEATQALLFFQYFTWESTEAEPYSLLGRERPQL